MTIPQYIESLNKRYRSGQSTEHTYRGDLESLIRELVPGVNITNEPVKVADCGNPDYVITKSKIPIGYIEAKDIGKDLTSKNYNEQFTRYKNALDNFLVTDYLWFRFYKHGEFETEIKIGEVDHKNKILPKTGNFDQFKNLIIDFCAFEGITIKSPKKLAVMMAAKARLLENTIENALNSDEQTQENSSLKGQFEAFQRILIHDLTPKTFSDIYAQTLAYGMFAARLNDTTLENFSRQEAAELIPKTNPFLRKLFQYVAGYDIDRRIQTTVENLADVFRATDVKELLKGFSNESHSQDPIIHFYETFLAEYDPKLRKKKGVYYTPEPVVNFIVRAVDDILKTEFGLKDGLADNSKTTIKVQSQSRDKRSKTGFKQMTQEVHKVQILDPATGTGTFLSEIVKHIYNSKFRSMHGAWRGYVENDLIPRLNGFELLMASYSMAHLKLGLLLSETGYKPKKEQRFRVYLTNSLEEHHPDTGTLFAQWLSSEASEANHVKRDTPVMVVLGNPPYSGESSNKGDWIMNLMEDYKKEPGGKEKLDEKNPKWLNDDYVKFIRYGQHFIEKNGTGILAFINPHGFLDNPTFRGMRWNLLKTYDKIYTIDLHGNSKKKEVSPDGSKDDNVFDIMQGVSINIFIKTGKKGESELGKLFHYDLYGKQENKYQFLLNNNINSVPYVELPNVKPNYFFLQKDFEVQKQYNKGFKINDLLKVNSAGIVTARDKLTIRDTKEEIINTINDFVKLEIDDARVKYDLGKDVRDWKISLAQKDLKQSNLSVNNIYKISYRPFDEKWTYYTGKSKGFHCMPRGEVMKHFVKGKNLGLTLCRQFKSGKIYQHIFVTSKIIESSYVSNKTSEITSVFPLYLYSNDDAQKTIENIENRTPNLNPEIVKEIANKLSLTFTSEKEQTKGTFASIDILDYIYAVLHSPAYREKYKEFLKIDFPRVPYPKDKDIFWKLVKLGGELREIHLLESPKVEKFITTYPEDGDNMITRKMTKNSPGWGAVNKDETVGRVWINDQQYFDKVPLVAWEFYIGGYQPAQKWLKDRHGRQLTFDDIRHYQKIIVALTETNRIMKEIDRVGVG